MDSGKQGEESEDIPVIEACACKTKALIRDIPVFEDWLEDGVNVYKAKDIDDFEIKIKKMKTRYLTQYLLNSNFIVLIYLLNFK